MHHRTCRGSPQTTTVINGKEGFAAQQESTCPMQHMSGRHTSAGYMLIHCRRWERCAYGGRALEDRLAAQVQIAPVIHHRLHPQPTINPT